VQPQRLPVQKRGVWSRSRRPDEANNRGPGQAADL
jgi:hypothetical protein